MTEKPFFVVKVKTGEKSSWIEACPRIWTGTDCLLWPKKKQSKLQKQVDAEPDEKKWHRWTNFKIKGYFDTFQEANDECTIIVNKSESECSEAQDSRGDRAKKREAKLKKKVPQKYLTTVC